MTPSFDVVVVGAGPVGLFLAARLAQRGLSVRVLERSVSTRCESRSIGIHPPSLRCLDMLGVADAMVREGVCVRTGLAFSEGGLLGEVRLDRAGGAFPYVLTLPQTRTEAILARRLEQLAPGALVRGANVHSVAPTLDDARVAYEHDGESLVVRARVVVGCDGARSTVRSLSRIPFPGEAYPMSFVMGDFVDRTLFGASAAVFLTENGLVESFPLPAGMRRWVVQVEDPSIEPSADALASRIVERTGIRVDTATLEHASAFIPERRLAARFVQGPVVLVGDAAHVLSPIGGQGMNLGWLDAWALAETLERRGPVSRTLTLALHRFGRMRKRRAADATRRAELNMWLGQSRTPSDLRRRALRSALRGPAAPLMTRLFTMRGL